MKRLGGIPSPSHGKQRSSPRILPRAPALDGRTAAPSILAGSGLPSAVEDHRGPAPPASYPSPRNKPTRSREGSDSFPPWSSKKCAAAAEEEVTAAVKGG
jgi:hypothetical protein